MTNPRSLKRPVAATVRITADGFHRLFINRAWVNAGSCRSWFSHSLAMRLGVVAALVFGAGNCSCLRAASDSAATLPIREEGSRLLLRANQVGYQPNDAKNAMAFAKDPLTGRFTIVDAGAGQEVFSGPPRLLAGEHWGPFSNHAELDFTALRIPGRYRIVMSGVSITEPDPLADFQDPRAVYHNDFQDYATNEPTMDGTASAVLLWSLCQTHG